jgi:hypothetical protein
VGAVKNGIVKRENQKPVLRRGTSASSLTNCAVSAVVEVKGPHDQVYALFATVSFFRIECPPVFWLAA